MNLLSEEIKGRSQFLQTIREYTFMDKSFLTSKELWLVALAILNIVLNQFGLPSFEPTPEFYGAVLVVVFVLRGWFTKAGIKWSL